MLANQLDFPLIEIQRLTSIRPATIISLWIALHTPLKDEKMLLSLSQQHLEPRLLSVEIH
jgi:hypothetical protein